MLRISEASGEASDANTDGKGWPILIRFSHLSPGPAAADEVAPKKVKMLTLERVGEKLQKRMLLRFCTGKEL